MLNVSYSSSADARSCWKKYYFRNVMRLSPKSKARSLSLGSVVHECFEMYFNGHPEVGITKHITTSYDTLIGSEDNPVEAEKLFIDKFTALAIWSNYPFNDLEFQKVLPERKFKVRLGNLRGIRFTGRVDGLVMKDGKWWIREVKITALDNRQFQGRAGVSYQGSGYIYGTEKQDKLKINGVLFDVIKRPLLRKGVNETAKDFILRIAEDYEKKPKFYYDRFYSYRSTKEIHEFEKDMVKLSREIRTRARQGDWFRNTDACWMYGKECPYKRICWMDDYDENMLNAYYERG